MTDQLDELPESVRKALDMLPSMACTSDEEDAVGVLRAALLRYREMVSDRSREMLRLVHESGELKTRAEKAEARVQELERENWELRSLSAAAYQAAGAYDMPVRFLDALCDAAQGEVGKRQNTDDLLPCDTPDFLQRAERAEAELAAIKKRIAESATATLRITYEEDRAMGVYLRDMDIGTLCWLDGECVALLPLDDEAKS